MAKTNKIKSVLMTYKDIEKNNILNNNKILGIIDFGDYRKLIKTLQYKPIPYIHLNIPVLTNDHYYELWLGEDDVAYYSNENFVYSHDGNYMFGVGSIEVGSKDIYDQTNKLYNELFKITKERGYPQLKRIWNYIPQINFKDSENKDPYEHFCSSRWQSFKENSICDFPAGTAVGCNSDKLAIYFISSYSNDSVFIENPNQIPAYEYNEKNSPCFSRGCYDPNSDIFYISGTASIISKTSTGIRDVKNQCKTTLENINHLISSKNLLTKGINKNYTLKDIDCIKIYVKHSSYLNNVKEICNNAFSNGAHIVYLQANICRPELLLEIEGIIQN